MTAPAPAPAIGQTWKQKSDGRLITLLRLEGGSTQVWVTSIACEPLRITTDWLTNYYEFVSAADLDARGQPIPDWAKEAFDVLSESDAAVSVDVYGGAPATVSPVSTPPVDAGTWRRTGWFYHYQDDKAAVGDFSIFRDRILLCRQTGAVQAFTPVNALGAQTALEERKKLMAPVPSTPSTKFKIGDRVRVVNEGAARLFGFVGDLEGVTTAVAGSTYQLGKEASRWVNGLDLELVKPEASAYDKAVPGWAAGLFATLLDAGFGPDNIGVDAWPKDLQLGDVKITSTTRVEVYIDRSLKAELLQNMDEDVRDFVERISDCVDEWNIVDDNSEQIPSWAVPIYKLLDHRHQDLFVTVGKWIEDGYPCTGVLAIFEQPMGEFDVVVWRADKPCPTFRYRPTMSLEDFAKRVLDCQKDLVEREERKEIKALEVELQSVQETQRREILAIDPLSDRFDLQVKEYLDSRIVPALVPPSVPTESTPMSDIPKIPQARPTVTETLKTAGGAALDGLAEGAVEEVGDVLLDLAREAAGDDVAMLEMILSSERGRELVKGLLALGILQLPAAGVKVPKAALVQKVALLQMRSSSRRLGAPLMRKGLRAIARLAEIGESLPELEDTATAGGAITDGRSGDAKVVDFSKAQADKVAAQ